MKEFARKFYLSKEWRAMREYVFQRDLGLCVRCGNPGEIVHHIVALTPKNINDPFISLNADNLETLCRECHGDEHNGMPVCDRSLRFDEFGNLITKQPIPPYGE